MIKKVSVAPMIDCTDRHDRYFLRLISKNVMLYTDMIVSEAIKRGDKKKLLSFNLKEKPQKEILEDESLPENNEISLEELENQEKIEESSSELDKPETSNNN